MAKGATRVAEVLAVPWDRSCRSLGGIEFTIYLLAVKTVLP
jgi:hypothetical protein